MCLVLTVMVVTMGMGTMTITSTAKRYSEKTLSGSINPDELTQMGISSEDFFQHLEHLSNGNINCGMHTMMTRHYIRNKTVTCNDGSPSGYYLRKSTTSSRWLIYLDGGWFCFDDRSCHSRWINSARLMSSYEWTPSRKGTGILSADHIENPYMYDVNTVAIPYCSSDAWSGRRQPRTKNDFAFLGAMILEEVIKDLVYGHGLGEATVMFLAGSSAGGTGVLINLDRIAGIMAHIASKVEVRGIVDSGWFLDNQQYQPSECHDVYSCSPTASIQKGISHWQGQVPDNCRKHYSERDEWRCYFGYRVYPTLKTPVFVVQHLFDEAQITADNVGSPVKREQWQYIHDVGQDMRKTLINVSAVFAPSCLSHILLTRNDWNMVSIRGVTLPQAIDCWEGGANEKNLHSRTTQGKYYIQLTERLITGEKSSKKSPDKLQADAPRKLQQHRKQKRHKRKGAEAKRNNKRRKLREREVRKKQKARERAKRRKEKEARRRKEREERKKRQRQERLIASKEGQKKTKKSSPGAGIQHHVAVYDYVIQQPASVVDMYEHSEHKTSESFYFNPLQPRLKDITPLQPKVKDPISSRAKSNNPSKPRAKKGNSDKKASVKRNRPPSPVKSRTAPLTKPKSTISPPQRRVKSKKQRTRQSPRTESQKTEKQRKPKSKKSVKQNNKKNKNKKRSGRSKRSSLIFDEHDVHHMEYHGNRCNHHRIDHCEWPQCNFSCPKIYNHFTGEEMDFIDLFMQFGLDMSSVASVLNMDVNAMQSMDKKQIIDLLINT